LFWDWEGIWKIGIFCLKNLLKRLVVPLENFRLLFLGDYLGVIE